MNTRDLGLLIARGAVGATVAAHGFQKLFGLFGGGGIEGTAANFEKMGFSPARESAMAAGAAEGIGGSLLLLGAATPFGAAAVAGNMAVAASVHRPNGFFAADGGLEHPAALGAVAAGIALTGPGNLSVDRLMGHKWSKGWMGLLALVAAGGAAASLINRREQALASAAGPTISEPAQHEDGDDQAHTYAA